MKTFDNEKELTFIDAVMLITESDHLSICDHREERTGEYPSICIYEDEEFVGKLRWPKDGKPGVIDLPESVLLRLRKRKVELMDDEDLEEDTFDEFPQEYQVWVNIHKTPDNLIWSSLFASKEQADKHVLNLREDRIACFHKSFFEGEGTK